MTIQSSTRQLWWARHAPSLSQGVCVGQTQVPLSLSYQQAAHQLICSAPITPDVIACSDQPRCSKLAEQLGAHWSVPVMPDIRLREISMGSWEGRTYQNINDTDPEAWQNWCQHWETQAPPGGETLDDLTTRVNSWYLDILHNSTFSANTPVLLVGHAGVIRTLWHLHGLSWMEAMSTPVSHLHWQLL